MHPEPRFLKPRQPPADIPYEVEVNGVHHRYLDGFEYAEHILFITACDLTGREIPMGFRPRKKPFVSEAFCLTCWSGVLLDGAA